MRMNLSIYSFSLGIRMPESVNVIQIYNIEAQSQHFQLFEYFRLFQTSSENTLKHDTTEFNKIQPVSHMAYSIRHNSARSYL